MKKPSVRFAAWLDGMVAGMALIARSARWKRIDPWRWRQDGNA
jgi:hypothetical protein